KIMQHSVLKCLLPLPLKNGQFMKSGCRRNIQRRLSGRKKSASARLALTSAGSLAGNGVSLPLLARLKRLEGLGAGAGHPEKRKRLSSSDGHKTEQRSGVLCHTAG